MQITSENWNYSHYTATKLLCSIFLGANENSDLIYSVTVTDLDHKEIFQEDFLELTEAVSFINSRYSHWDFVDKTQKPISDSDSGCGSCAAH